MSRTGFSIFGRPGRSPNRPFTAALLTLFFLLSNGRISRAQTCVAPPAGLTAWWTADNNLQDVAGGKIAVRNVISFVPGNVARHSA